MKVIDEIDGSKVIMRQPARGPHPNPTHNYEVTFTGVTHLLCANGTEWYACDECEYTSSALRSAVSHKGSHARDAKPLTDEVVIRDVLRTMKRIGNVRGAYTQAAQELNRRGVTPALGGRWTPGSVRHIAKAYEHAYRVHVRRPRSADTTRDDATGAVSEANVIAGVDETMIGGDVRTDDRVDYDVDVPDETTVTRFFGLSADQIAGLSLAEALHAFVVITESCDIARGSIQRQTEQLAHLIECQQRLIERLEALAQHAREHTQLDEQTIDKARRYDEIRAMLP